MSIFAPVITCNSDRITVLNSNSIDVRIYIQKNSVERYEEQYWIDHTQSYARTNSVITFDGIGTSNLGYLSPEKGFFAAWYRIRFVAADGSGRISEWVYCPISAGIPNSPTPTLTSTTTSTSISLVPPIIFNKLVSGIDVGNNTTFVVYNLNDISVSCNIEGSSNGSVWTTLTNITINANSFASLNLLNYAYIRCRANIGSQISDWSTNYAYNNNQNLLSPIITVSSSNLSIRNPNNLNIYVQLQRSQPPSDNTWRDWDDISINSNSSISLDYSFTETGYSWRARLWSQSLGTSVSDWGYSSSTPANSPTSTPTRTEIVSFIPTPSPTSTNTPTPTATPNSTPTSSPAVVEIIVSEPGIPLPLPSPTKNILESSSINIIPHNNCLCPEITRTPTRTSTPTSSPTPTPTITVTSSVTPTLTSTPTPTPTTTITKSLTPTPTPTRTETSTPTPTPTITVTPTQTRKNCCEWDGNAKIYYAIACVNGSPVWRNLNIKFEKISNYQWVFNKIVECNELLDVVIVCNPNIIFNGSDLSCSNKWSIVVNKWPCHNAPFTTTMITSSNINNLNLPQVMKDDIISSVSWPKACECNIPYNILLNGTFDASNCSCCLWCNTTWTSTYDCTTLAWSQPIPTTTYSYTTQQIESSDWSISGRNATFNSAGVLSISGDCASVPLPTAPAVPTIYPGGCSTWMRTEARIGSNFDVTEQRLMSPTSTVISSRNADFNPSQTYLYSTSNPAVNATLQGNTVSVKFGKNAGTGELPVNFMPNNTVIRFASITGTTGLVINTNYFVINSTVSPGNPELETITATWNLSDTMGGPPLSFTNGSATIGGSAATPPLVGYPDPTSSSQTIQILFDPALRTVRYKLQNAVSSGGVGPEVNSGWSVFSVPSNRWTSQTIDYPIDIFIQARNLGGATFPASSSIIDCTLAVNGEPVVQIPNTTVSGVGSTGAATNVRIMGKLGKGFAINGTLSYGWQYTRGTSLTASQIWFSFIGRTGE